MTDSKTCRCGLVYFHPGDYLAIPCTHRDGQVPEGESQTLQTPQNTGGATLANASLMLDTSSAPHVGQ